jgi:hypothetical protein
MAKPLAAFAAAVFLLAISSTYLCAALAYTGDSNEAITTSMKASSNFREGLTHQLDKIHGADKQQHWNGLSRRLLGATPCER